MALVQLSDAIIPEVYESYTAVDNPELTAFYESGVVVQSDLINALADGGKTVHVPFWNDIDPTVEPNYSSDDPNTSATPEKITAAEMIARNAYMNKAFSAADLVSELAGSDPMQRIRNRFGRYWTRQWQRRIIAMFKGILADNIANDSSDMVVDASIADGDNATSDNVFNRKLFTSAVFTLGDAFNTLSAIAVHSVVYKRMVDNDDIEFIKDSAGTVIMALYMGHRVIVDDSMPVVAGGTSGFVYTSILFGGGAVGYGDGNPRVPVEVFRNPAQGNGGGVEQLWERKTYLLHPFGYKWTETTVTGNSPTLANLALAANWDRVVVRKNLPFAFIKTNG
jgi:hypothetical protein